MILMEPEICFLGQHSATADNNTVVDASSCTKSLCHVAIFTVSSAEGTVVTRTRDFVRPTVSELSQNYSASGKIAVA